MPSLRVAPLWVRAAAIAGIAAGAAGVVGGAALAWDSSAAAGALVVAGAALATSVAGAWVISRPLDALAGAVRRGRRAPNVAHTPAREVGLALDELADRLDAKLEERRGARIEAEEADRYETQFLQNLSHELRTPLNSVLGFCEVLRDEIDGPLTDSQREDVETIFQSGQHLSGLVDDVLDLAAMHSGKVELRRERVDLGSLAREVVRLLEGQRRGKAVAIGAEVDEAVPAVDADPKRLRQVLVNLGTNALKFTDHGSVVLRVTPEDEGVRLTVKDTGSGIAAEELEAIFQEFTQASGVSGASRRRRPRGTGLGLAICKRLTELHGGQIWAESVLGEGSSFHVWIPREAPGAESVRRAS